MPWLAIAWWTFRKVRWEIKVETQSQFMQSDVATMHAVSPAGYGIAQVLELGVGAHLPEWTTSATPFPGLGVGTFSILCWL